MKIVAIVQARNGSTRFPKKVMELINGKTLIEILLKRLSGSRLISFSVVATTTSHQDDTLADHIKNAGFQCFRGSENDVLERYQRCASHFGANLVVRITGDCPLIDPVVVDQCIEKFLQCGADYVSNLDPPTFPDGLDVEVFSSVVLKKAADLAVEKYDREHVTPFIRNSDLFSKHNLTNNNDYSERRWTVDTKEDLKVVKAVFDHFGEPSNFGWEEIVNFQNANPQSFLANKNLKRNEGAKMSASEKLWKRAERSILGGTMLLSKHPDMFLPGKWPTYFSKAKDCEVWDLEGTSYLDMSIMGVGTNILGYCNSEIDDAVQQAVTASNMSTLNCPEEVYLAEALLELNRWADMVKFARSGAEANSIAVRIARAASGRDNVAICGYHGWSDWYLAANISSEDKLTGHLLPGLPPLGVPNALRESVYPFRYNEFEELEDIVAKNNIGVIFMEVQRNDGPKEGFLKKVRKLANDKGIVLIFDECTSGFRETDSGICKKYGVEPDIIVFGKALGNGFAITAVLGRRSVMEAGQNSFISSTFWTERLGPTAAVKTLEIMNREKSWLTITSIGNQIREGLRQVADHNRLQIEFSGLPALTSFSFNKKRDIPYKTLIAQEMLKRGFLASNLIYTSTSHSPAVIQKYIDAMDQVASLIYECEDGRDPKELIEGENCRSGFKRMN